MDTARRHGELVQVVRAIAGAVERPRGVLRNAVNEMPLLLVVLFVLFVTAEVWQLAAVTPPERLAVLFVVFAGSTVLLLVRATQPDRDELVVERDGNADAVPTSTGRQILASLVTSLVIHVAAVGVVTFAAFAIIGALAISLDLQELWTGQDLTSLLPAPIGLTVELLSLAALLGAIAALSFAVKIARDPILRARLQAHERAAIRSL